jgi:hypothetical protein
MKVSLPVNKNRRGVTQGNNTADDLTEVMAGVIDRENNDEFPFPSREYFRL